MSLGAKFVSNSYGVPGEDPSEGSYDHYYDHAGVAVVVASGDTGNVTEWPATNPNVVAVGGTRLTKDGTVARGWTEATWGVDQAGQYGSGSGCSPYEPRPDYQAGIDTNCPNNKATADIAADADPASGLATYDTLGVDGWLQVGGTSLAAPLVTAMYAMAGSPAPDTYPVTYPYGDPQRADHLFDITDGANGSCGNVLCQAGPGWDGPTGLGTPNGVAGADFRSAWPPHRPGDRPNHRCSDRGCKCLRQPRRVRRPHRRERRLPDRPAGRQLRHDREGLRIPDRDPERRVDQRGPDGDAELRSHRRNRRPPCPEPSPTGRGTAGRCTPRSPSADTRTV